SYVMVIGYWWEGAVRRSLRRWAQPLNRTATGAATFDNLSSRVGACQPPVMDKVSDWKVGEHGPIEKLEPNLWRVEGEVAGTSLRRVMVLAKMADGGVVVHNGIALEEYLMREIDDWGEVRYVVVPNAYHRLDCARFKRRYAE